MKRVDGIRSRRSGQWPQLIDRVLAEAQEREIEALMAAGYQAMAGENAELAEEGLESFWEIVQDDAAWPTAPDKTNAPA